MILCLFANRYFLAHICSHIRIRKSLTTRKIFFNTMCWLTYRTSRASFYSQLGGFENYYLLTLLVSIASQYIIFYDLLARIRKSNFFISHLLATKESQISRCSQHDIHKYMTTRKTDFPNINLLAR